MFKPTLATALAGLLIGTLADVAEASAADCTPAHKIEGLVSPGKLTVATYEYPPFTITAGGQIGGVEGEVLKKIAATECLTLTTEVVDPAAAIQYVLAGKADVAAGDWYRTAARAKVMNLSAPIYVDQMGFYSKDGVSTFDSLIGRQVGTISGFLWVAEMQKLLGANLRLYPNPVALAKDLELGRVEIGVDGFSTGTYAQTKGEYPGMKIKVPAADPRVQASMQPGQSNFPYAKTNVSLGAALDADIVAMHADGTIAASLKSFGLDASGADVGEPRVMQ
jgi:polar amino acid transport system substrate-binding protein